MASRRRCSVREAVTTTASSSGTGCAASKVGNATSARLARAIELPDMTLPFLPASVPARRNNVTNGLSLEFPRGKVDPSSGLRAGARGPHRLPVAAATVACDAASCAYRCGGSTGCLDVRVETPVSRLTRAAGSSAGTDKAAQAYGRSAVGASAPRPGVRARLRNYMQNRPLYLDDA